MIQKFITDIGLKGVNEEERSFVAWASKGTLDRDDEIIDPAGWQLQNFKKNPVIPLFHNYSGFPVAKSIWTKQEPKDKPIGILFKPQFAETALGMEAFYLYQNGYMNAFSVGFDPVEWEADGQQYSKAKDGDFAIWCKGYEQQKKKKPRCKYLKQDLLEISGVLVPAHPDALIEARSHVSTPELTKYLDMMIEKQSEPEMVKLKAEIQKLQGMIVSAFGMRLMADDGIFDDEADMIDASEYDDLDLEFIDEDEELEFIEDDKELALEFIEG